MLDDVGENIDLGKWVRVFMLIPVFGPNSDGLPSPFGQGAGVP
jgi:hypothetical protein